MKKLTRKIVALTLSLVMCISFSNTTFAYADNENISSSAEASKVNWWKIGQGLGGGRIRCENVRL